MPQILNSRMPLPSNWQEFESITQSALKIRENWSDFSKNGRGGQKQYGVDVFGNINGRKIGAQCKLTFKVLSISTIDKEISNAKLFKPQLDYLLICTTAPRDAKLQSYVWNMKQEFSVNILFWDDITSELEKDMSVFKLHFPFVSDETTVEMTFLNDYRNIIDYVIKKDPCGEPIILNKVTDLNFLLQKWIMPDLYSKDPSFKLLQSKIISNLNNWISYMNLNYMHELSGGDRLFCNVHPIENLEEMRDAMLPIRQEIYDNFEKICSLNLMQ